MREIQFMSDFNENEKNSFRFVILFSSESSFKKSKSFNKSKKIRSFLSSLAISYVFNEKMLYDKKTMFENSALYKINSSNVDDLFCLMSRLVIIKFKASKHAEIKFFIYHLICMKTLISWKFIKKNKHAWLNVKNWRQIKKLLKYHFETDKKCLNVEMLYKFNRVKNDQFFFHRLKCLSLLSSKNLWTRRQRNCWKKAKNVLDWKT